MIKSNKSIPHIRWNVEKVREYLKDYGYELISDTYVNYTSKLKMNCPNGHICEVSLMHFKAKIKPWRCGHKDCNNHRRKWDINKVREYAENAGYTLLTTEYIDSDMLIDMICPVGHKCSIKWCTFSSQTQGRCGNYECSQKRLEESHMAARGVPNPFQDPVIIEQIKHIHFEKRGVVHPMQDPEVQAKYRATCNERLGVPNPLQNPGVKSKSVDTCMKNYGVPYSLQDPGVRLKGVETCMEKYGVPNAMQDPAVKLKGVITCMEKYGVPYASQNPEIHAKQMKSAFSTKEYIFPSGRTVMIQGYENIAIDYLLSLDIQENDMLFGEDVPTISYVNEENNPAVYFPDAYIRNYNTIIEVKSTYTFEIEEQKNLLKFEATARSGYNLCVLIFKNKKNLEKQLFYQAI